jgi:hypothetical protein
MKKNRENIQQSQHNVNSKGRYWGIIAKIAEKAGFRRFLEAPKGYGSFLQDRLAKECRSGG